MKFKISNFFRFSLTKYELLTLLIICISCNVEACTCTENFELKNQISKSDFIFSGRVIKIETKYIKDTINFYEIDSVKVKIVSFKIKKILKGHLSKTSIVQIYTGVNEDECGFLFLKNKKYIVYSSILMQLPFVRNRMLPFFYTSKCYRTKLFNFTELRLIKENIFSYRGS